EVDYIDPGDHENHFLHLEGLWRNGPESLLHARETSDYDDYIGIKFSMGPASMRSWSLLTGCRSRSR
ncbi:MAG: hypothetical protein QF717_15865, partial [SAR202 cluster bacterium]|nr:hypothetical protein [SAR202 cluster bacterium]